MRHCIHSLGFFIIFSPERNVQAFVDGRVSSRMCMSQNPSRGGKEPHVKEVRDGRVIYNPVSRFSALLDFLFPGVLGSINPLKVFLPSIRFLPPINSLRPRWLVQKEYYQLLVKTLKTKTHFSNQHEVFAYILA